MNGRGKQNESMATTFACERTATEPQGNGALNLLVLLFSFQVSKNSSTTTTTTQSMRKRGVQTKKKQAGRRSVGLVLFVCCCRWVFFFCSTSTDVSADRSFCFASFRRRDSICRGRFPSGESAATPLVQSARPDWISIPSSSVADMAKPMEHDSMTSTWTENSIKPCCRTRRELCQLGPDSVPSQQEIGEIQ